MTLSPLASNQHLAVGVKGPSFKVGPKCANPRCHNGGRRWAEHAHHIFRRSALGGDFKWVEIDGFLVGNLTGLCVPCHNDVTGEIGGHRAAIRWDARAKVFNWCRVVGHGNEIEFLKVGPLDPQPPTPDSLTARASGPKHESEACPFCGQTRRRRKSPASTAAGQRRRRKNWIVSVPGDSEDGAGILDAFVDDVAELLGAGEWDERNRRYWALVHALAWLMQHREEFARDAKAEAA
jgi:hypothetical protein